MLIKATTLDPFFLGLDTAYQRGYTSAISTYEKWSQTVPSTTRTMAHAWIDKFPKVREWIGPRHVENIVAQYYALENKKFELTVAVERTDVEDDNFGIYAPLTEMMGIQAREWPDDLLTTLLEDGENQTTFDGAAFFSASHPVDTTDSGAGTQSNLITSKPLTADNLAYVDAAMMKFKGRDGKPMSYGLTDIMVPPALKHKAMQLANAELVAAADGVNAATGGSTNVLRGTFNVIVNPKLTSDTTWYALDNRWPIKAFIFQLRKAPEFSYLVNPTDLNVFNDDQYKYGVRMRGAAGLGMWWMAVKVTA